MISIDLVVAERCAHYGIIATCLKNRPAQNGGDVLSAARMRIAWELRREWRKLGFVIQPSLPQIANAVGYRSNAGVIEAVERMDRKSMEVAL